MNGLALIDEPGVARPGHRALRLPGKRSYPRPRECPVGGLRAGELAPSAQENEKASLEGMSEAFGLFAGANDH